MGEYRPRPDVRSTHAKEVGREMGTFLVSWQMGTGCGGGDAAGTCTYHECAFRRALRWLLREIRAAALWSTIRAQVRLIVGTCHDSVGDGFVPCEFGVPARALMIGAYAVRPTVTASPVPRTGKRVCRPTGWEEKSAASMSRFFSQPSQGHFSFAGKWGRTAVGGSPGARPMGMQ